MNTKKGSVKKPDTFSKIIKLISSQIIDNYKHMQIKAAIVWGESIIFLFYPCDS